MPTEADVAAWIRRNEAVREAELTADRSRTMAELLEETARLSRVMSEMRENIEPRPDVRSA